MRYLKSRVLIGAPYTVIVLALWFACQHVLGPLRSPGFPCPSADGPAAPAQEGGAWARRLAWA